MTDNKQLLLEGLKAKLGQKTKEPNEKNPYNQKGIEEFVASGNYNIEEKPILSKIAESLNAPKPEVVEKEAPKKTIEIKEEDLDMLQKFIAKYKGKK